MRLVPVGRVGRPHGVDGSFVVDGASEDPERFVLGASVLVDGTPARVISHKRVAKGRPAIRLDRPAERGATLAVPASDLPVPEEGGWYTFELVGLAVEDEGGAPLGLVVDVYPGTANDNLELDNGTLVPLIDDAVREVDRSAGRIVVNRGFLGL